MSLEICANKYMEEVCGIPEIFCTIVIFIKYKINIKINIFKLKFVIFFVNFIFGQQFFLYITFEYLTIFIDINLNKF